MNYRLGFKSNLHKALSDKALPDDIWIPLDLKSLQALSNAGVKTHIPSLFYDNDAYNRISLEIYNVLLDALAECGGLLKTPVCSKYLNLVGVFFQEILRILCAYCFKCYELDYLIANYDVRLNDIFLGTPSRSPYVDYDFVADPNCGVIPTTPTSKKRSLDPRHMARTLLDVSKNLSSRRRRGKKFRLLCTSNVSMDVRQIRDSLNVSSSANWEVNLLRAGQATIDIPRFDEQFRILQSNLHTLGHNLGFEIPSSLIKIIEQRIKPFISGGKDFGCLPDVLLTGSTLNQEARVTAARMKSEGVSVVSIFHGEACGAHDEPIFGYGENTFNDAVIGYGDNGCSLAVNGEHAASLFDDPVRYVPSTSAKVRDIFVQDQPARMSEIESPRIMYVPTSFIDAGRYGPYRDMHDVAYMNWQRRLMACAGKIFPEKVIWKPHIKETVDVPLPKISGVSIILDRRFEDMIGDVDVFVFDYVSTAFTLAAATTKPIIFLDIGLRNLNSQAMEYVRDRCIYLPVSPQEPEKAFRDALAMADKQCVNQYTPGLSLSNDARTRHEVIAETISRLVQKV